METAREQLPANPTEDHDSAERAGRNPADIEVSTTVEVALPEDDEQSEQLVERLTKLADLGVQHFVMDFGHPKSTEHIARFAEQVKGVLLQ